MKGMENISFTTLVHTSGVLMGFKLCYLVTCSHNILVGFTPPLRLRAEILIPHGGP